MNPIIQMLNAKQMLKNPQTIYENMLRTNPQFKKFVEDNKGKSAEQIAKENGIDLSALREIFK